MNAQVLSEGIRGFYRDYTNSKLPAALQLAPAYGQASLRGEFLIRKSDNRYDKRTDDGPIAFDASFRKGNTDLAVEDVQLRRYAAPYELLPYSISNSVAETVDLVQPIVNGQLDWVFGQYINALSTQIAALSAGTALDLSSNSEAVAAKLRETIRDIQRATGRRPNVIYMGPEALDAFLAQNDLFSQGGIALATTPTTQARLGAADEPGAAAWFQRVLGLQLLVEDHVELGSSGADFQIGATAVVAHAAPGSNDSCFKTFHQTFGADRDFARFEVEEAAKPLPRGQIITCEAVFDAKAVTPQLGRKIALTLP